MAQPRGRIGRSRRHLAALQSRNSLRKIFRSAGSRNPISIGANEWAAAVRRLLKPNGSLFLNLGAAPSNPMLPHELVLRLRKICSFCKIRFTGSRRSRSRRRGQADFARAFQADQFAALSERLPRIHFSSHAGRTDADSIASRSAFPMPTKATSRAGATRGGSDRRCRGNTWFIPYETIQRRAKERPHPATFPVQLAANCIQAPRR